MTSLHTPPPLHLVTPFPTQFTFTFHPTSTGMPRVPNVSPATGLPVPAHYIHTLDANFVDTHGRTLLLRGVNLSGASKAPVGHPSHLLEDFWDSAEAGGESFVGRPLNIDDGSADIHLARLRGWGFNMLRFPIAWEALEHEGPGKYDYEFMDYTIRVLQKCKDYGFRVFLDPHQDTWSRFTGGSGAPYWTLAACGINPSNITATQAAIIHCEYPTPYDPQPADQPAMIWSTNYGRLLSQTLFTFFFAGKTFAPNCIIDGVNIQDWLQDRYVEAFGRLADRIAEYDARGVQESRGTLFDECVIGWDSMNEPFEGLVGWNNLNENPKEQGSTLKKGTYPTPAQGLRLGMGEKQTVENWTFGAFGPSRNGSVTVDPKGHKVWVDPAAVEEPHPTASPSSSSSSLTAPPPPGELPSGHHPHWGWTRDTARWKLGTCPWAQHGVWDVQTGYVLRPDYFKYHPRTGVEVEFLEDFWKVHFVRWKERIGRAHREAVWFVQPPVFVRPICLEGGEGGVDDEAEVEAEESQESSEETLTTSNANSKSIVNGRACYSCHYYDGLTLITRHWNWFNADALGVLRGKYDNILKSVKVGEGAIRKSLREQLGILKEDALIIGGCVPPGGSSSSPSSSSTPSSSSSSSTTTTTTTQFTPVSYPTLIGEIGTPFDMDAKASYGWTHGGKYRYDYSAQRKALDASLNACDGANCVNWTVWNFVGEGHCAAWGDGWNLEDLSLWSGGDVWGLDGGEGGEGSNDGKAVEDGDGKDGKLIEGVNEGANESRPSLVNRRRGRRRHVKPGLAAVAAASSLSVATLGSVKSGGSPSSSSSSSSLVKAKALVGANAPPNPNPKLDPSANPNPKSTLNSNTEAPPLKKYGVHENPFDFLNDGARAVKAFCRPYPVKSVGVVKGLEFEVDKARVEVVVEVRWEDGEALGVGASKGGNGERERAATEIFLPIVHFVHPRFLEDEPKLMASYPAYDGDDDEEGDGKGERKGEGEGKEKVRYRDWEEWEELVDVEVVVSEGRWEVRGQRLFWWYEVPEGPGSVPGGGASSGDGDASGGQKATATKGPGGDGPAGVKQVKIEVRRRGGAVKQGVVDVRRKKYERLVREERGSKNVNMGLTQSQLYGRAARIRLPLETYYRIADNMNSDDPGVHALALVSPELSHIANSVLYRTVVLDLRTFEGERSVHRPAESLKTKPELTRFIKGLTWRREVAEACARHIHPCCVEERVLPFILACAVRVRRFAIDGLDARMMREHTPSWSLIREGSD
ncbi:glycoside hydrolase [Coprinopsis marcescibilis]|uniref:Glycoside hydrolase n=1 Tax=Coprinopsis marcescibilis TaxID=230819 RepID=A0A5C3KQL7_COPMA|nr:glycoside hydrolase [Coprinopsis marcescibilis]